MYRPATSRKAPKTREILESVIEDLLERGILLPEISRECEKIFITAALRRTNGSVQKAAELTGIHRNTLSKKIREYGIDRSRTKQGRSETDRK